MEIKLTPFTFINNLNEGSRGKDLFSGHSAAPSEHPPEPGSAEKAYTPFIINRGFSYFNDSVLFANEMNIHHALPAKMQYDFYRHGLRPRKRFSKWFKREPDNKNIDLICEHYGYSREYAREIIDLFTPKQLDDIAKYRDCGGKSK